MGHTFDASSKSFVGTSYHDLELRRDFVGGDKFLPLILYAENANEYALTKLTARFQTGEVTQSLRLCMHDTGGQLIFLQILDLLTSPHGTAYLVVFSLPTLQSNFKRHRRDDGCAARVDPGLRRGRARHHRRHAQGRGRGWRGGVEAAERRPAPRAEEAVRARRRGARARQAASGLCFFGVENSRGYAGDATIQELVKAIERAAHRLPSMKQMMPLKWLRVNDTLRKLAASRRHVRLETVRQIAIESGLPHEGLELEQVATTRCCYPMPPAVDGRSSRWCCRSLPSVSPSTRCADASRVALA